MAEDEELVKKLRSHNGWALNETLDEAADAIEELSKRVPSVPHGRLIDADALIIDLMDRGVESLQTDDWHEIQQAVMDAPTIIQAEEGE